MGSVLRSQSREGFRAACRLVVTMIYPDPETARLFVRERQDAYLRDAELARLARPLAEARRHRRRQLGRQLRLRLANVVTQATRQLRPVDHTS